MNDWLKENWFKACIAAAILLAGYAVFYYYLTYLPANERARLAQEQVQADLQKQAQDLEKTKLDEQQRAAQAQEDLQKTKLEQDKSAAQAVEARKKNEQSLLDDCISQVDPETSAGIEHLIADHNNGLSPDLDVMKAIDAMNKWAEQQKVDCVRKYPQN